MKLGIVLAAVLLLAAGGVFAQEAVDEERVWGFGWDQGLTLRRQLGAWQIGVSAGPNDMLSDSYEHEFGTGIPDSLQGGLTNESHDRRESGYVRLHLAREVAQHRTLDLSAVLSGKYWWSDGSETYRRLSDYPEEFVQNRLDVFTDQWDILLGARLAWRPVPFLSLEQEFGLRYFWRRTESKTWRKRPDEVAWTLDETETSDKGFRDFGPNDLTYDIQICLWF